MISVRRARVLPPPSFRFRLTTDTFGFGYDLPAAGRSRDFHPLERALAGRTEKGAAQSSHFAAAPVFWGDSLKYRTSLPAVVMLTKETGVGSLS